MIRLILLFASAFLLLTGTVRAQDSQQPPTDSKPAEAQPAQEPEKKPDAFQYFFGKKREEKKKVPEAQKPASKAPEAKAPAAPAKAPEVVPEKPMSSAEPASAPVVAVPVVEAPVLVTPSPEPALKVRPEPPVVTAPQTAPPPVLAPAPAPEALKEEEPKVDAFQYFFGHATQPLPEAKREEALVLFTWLYSLRAICPGSAASSGSICAIGRIRSSSKRPGDGCSCPRIPRI